MNFDILLLDINRRTPKDSENVRSQNSRQENKGIKGDDLPIKGKKQDLTPFQYMRELSLLVPILKKRREVFLQIKQPVPFFISSGLMNQKICNRVV